MKIAIITFFQSQDNYGQLLQCYALQRVLHQLGHKPYLIRYGFHNEYFHWLKKRNIFTKEGRKKILRQLKHVFFPRKRVLDRRFDNFRKKHLAKSWRCYNNLAELQRNPPKADCYITGSDQVWAQMLSKNDNRSFFLDFGLDHVKRIAYAPSFAVECYPEELKEKLANQLERFDAVSVREQTGVSICKSVGFNSTLVLDPTILLTAQQYNTLIKEPKVGRYCFIYQVNVTSKKELWWDEFSSYNRDQGIKSIATFANPIEGVNMEILEGAEYIYPSIEEWLGLVREAEYILTSSFHGVVFSIIFHKPFVVCLRRNSMYAGNDRVFSLLEQLNLSDRIMQPDKSASEVISKKIDWDAVENRLIEKRKESIDFLKNSILQ